MSRFESVIRKLDSDKQKTINEWIGKVTDPVAQNVAENLKAEEHFEETALEGFLNILGNELQKSPNLDKKRFEELVKYFVLNGDQVNIQFPSEKHYRLVKIDDLRRTMKIPSIEKDKVLPQITRRYKKRNKRPIPGNLVFEKPVVWSTFEWPEPERPYNGLSPRESLDRSGITWIEEEDAVELVFQRDAIIPLRYPTVADANWNECFCASEKNDPFGYARIPKTGAKGFPEVVHSNAPLQIALIEAPKFLK